MALGITPIEIVNKGTHPLLVKDSEWERVELSNIADVQNGYAFSSGLFNHKEGLPLIRIRDIFSTKTENYYSGDYSEDFVVSHNDILIGMDGDFKISRWPGQKGLLNQRVCRIRFFSSYYLESFLFICVQPYLDAIHSETSAVTVKHLSSRTINDIPLPLPPLPIQRAIVSKIEALFSDLDNGIANFKKAQEQLKIYRQAVLKKAFEGGFSITNEENQSNHNNQKNHSSDNLPKGWKWVKLKDISEFITDGDHQAPPKADEGIPFITISNVNKNTNKINFDNTFKVKSEYYFGIKDHRKPKIGDILYTVTGSFGIPIIIDFEKEFCFQRHIGLIRPLSSVNQKYLYYLLQTNAVFNQASETATGTAQKTVALSSLRNFTIPFCSSTQEQTQIVQEIESRLSVCDKVEQSITESIEKAEALRQSILKKAFEGKLLSQAEIELCKQAADYEPASELLKKIQAEKLAILQQAQDAKKKKPSVKKKSKN